MHSFSVSAPAPPRSVYMAGVSFVSPFQESSDNLFSMLCQIQLFFVLMACLLTRFGKEMGAAVTMLELCAGPWNPAIVLSPLRDVPGSACADRTE